MRAGFSDLSLEARVALLPPGQREAVLDGLDPDLLLYDWVFAGRPSQLAATSSRESVVLFSAGRGSGKTRSGSEWIRKQVEPGRPPIRVHLVGRTIADVRDTMIQGEAGLLSVFPPSQAPEYIPTLRLVKFANGSVAHTFSAIEPDQLRGPQSHVTWADELAAWSFVPGKDGLTAWDNVRIGTRLGAHPQVFVSTTPRRIPAIQALYADAAAGKRVSLHTASTFDNPHLSPEYLDVIRGLYEGTRLGAQELYAQLIERVEGAIWSLEAIEADRVDTAPPNLPLRVVAVDPSVADNPGDECGIIVVGATSDSSPIKRHGYVLEDRSVLGSPSRWARAVVAAARDHDAPVVAEGNQGGALVREVIHGIDPKVRVRLVTAKVGKALRAEPVSMAYDQHRVHHVGYHTALEDQMSTWVPGETRDSPDRLDALVHGLASLMVPSASRSGVGPIRVSAPGRHTQVPVGVSTSRPTYRPSAW